MTTLKTIVLFLSITLFISCNKNDKSDTKTTINKKAASNYIKLNKAEEIINQTIAEHGGDLYKTAHYAFVFRDNKYQFKNDGANYKYTKTTTKGKDTIKDILKNSTFYRVINGKPVTLTEKEIAIGSGAINSVFYFAMLPHKLNDAAVNSKYIESTTINNKNYDVIEITFDEEGGGEDHDDVFYYWINKDTKKIDYLAYSYKVNNGGVRFRSAYNTRVIDGITFQDYINYKADIDTPLKDLPSLYEAGKLKELSKVKTENIINLNN